MTRILTLLAAALCVAQASAQTEGNNVFGPDHILQVDIDFYSPSYWNELLTEYDGEQITSPQPSPSLPKLTPPPWIRWASG